MPKIKMLRLPAVLERVGYKRTQVYKLMKEKMFPKPVKLGARCVAWPETVIDDWLSEKITESEGPTKPPPSSKKAGVNRRS